MKRIASMVRATGPATTKYFGPMRPRTMAHTPVTPAQAKIPQDFSDIPIPAGVEGPVNIVEGPRYKVVTKGVPTRYLENT